MCPASNICVSTVKLHRLLLCNNISTDTGMITLCTILYIISLCMAYFEQERKKCSASS